MTDFTLLWHCSPRCPPGRVNRKWISTLKALSQLPWLAGCPFWTPILLNPNCSTLAPGDPKEQPLVCSTLRMQPRIWSRTSSIFPKQPLFMLLSWAFTLYPQPFGPVLTPELVPNSNLAAVAGKEGGNSLVKQRGKGRNGAPQGPWMGKENGLA